MNRAIRMLGIGALIAFCSAAWAATQPPRQAPTLSVENVKLAKSNLIVRIDPKYPTQAARDGLEGWVMLSYTIDNSGRVTDITVLDASPQRIFDREARRALAKWRYKPAVKGGKAQAVPGVMVLLEFNLSD